MTLSRRTAEKSSSSISCPATQPPTLPEGRTVRQIAPFSAFDENDRTRCRERGRKLSGQGLVRRISENITNVARGKDWVDRRYRGWRWYPGHGAVDRLRDAAHYRCYRRHATAR